MKIAVACEENGAISGHFGRSAHLEVYEVRDKQVVGNGNKTERSGCGHHGEGHHGGGHSGGGKALPDDCRFVLCGGIGSGAAGHLAEQGVRPVVVKDRSLTPRQAVEAFLEDRLEQGDVHACCHNHGGGRPGPVSRH